MQAAAAATASAGMQAFYDAHGETPENVVAAMIRAQQRFASSAPSSAPALLLPDANRLLPAENVKDGLFFTILDNVEGFEYGMTEQITRRMEGQISGQGALGPDFINANMQEFMASVTAPATARL